MTPQDALLAYLEREHGFRSRLSSGARGRVATGCCPRHPDRTPSFVVYLDAAPAPLGYCFGGGCGLWGDLPRLCQELRFGGGPPTAACFRWLEEHGYRTPRDRRHHEQQPQSAPQEAFFPAAHAPTEEEQDALEVAMRWWHRCLTERDDTTARRARSYLVEERGASAWSLTECLQVGYAPPSGIPGYQREMVAHFRRQLGERHWLRLLKAVGVFYGEGRWAGYLRLHSRLLFTCCDKTTGRPVFYQGRVAPGAPEGAAKFLNPSGLCRVGFRLPQRGEPALPFPVLVESPLGALVGHQHHLVVEASLGKPSVDFLAGIAEDRAALAEDGDVAGDEQARFLGYDAEFLHKAVFRVRPPEGLGFDEWLAREGVQPFLVECFPYVYEPMRL